MLLCSDGLTEMVPDEEIKGILQTETEPERACQQLVTRANEAGGKDNITAVVAHFRTANQAAGPAQTHTWRTGSNGKTEPVTASCPSMSDVP